jgi:hypothetical protein
LYRDPGSRDDFLKGRNALQCYRTWLLELARQTMLDEGSEDTAHDYDHLVRVMALAETIQLPSMILGKNANVVTVETTPLLAQN